MTSVIKWVNYRFHLRASQYVLYQILLRSDYAIRMLGKHKKYEENATVNIGHLSNILFKFHFSISQFEATQWCTILRDYFFN